MEQSKLVEEISVTANFVGVSIRTYLSIQHIKSAVYFANKAKEQEVAIISGESNDYSILTTYVLGAVMSSVAFLEATVNEFFITLKEQNFDMVPVLNVTDIPSNNKMSTHLLGKFEEILKAYGKIIDSTSLIYQDVYFSIKIRNGFTHYQADWLDLSSDHMPISNGSVYQSDYSEKLNSFKVPELTSIDNKHWINANFAKFVVESLIKFNEHFFSLLNHKSFIDHVKSDLILNY